MERHEKIVIDASVVVKWFTPEKNYERALKIRDTALKDRLEIVAPTLILYEVANALRFHRAYKLAAQTMLKALFSIQDFVVILKPDEKVWHKTLELSIENDISLYDAVYAALASLINIPLVTSDLDLYDKLRDKIDIIILSEF